MKHQGSYLRLMLMMVLSLVAMFVFMYAMVDVLTNAVPNVNQFYMAALMAAPMLGLEIVLMGKMYPRKGLNALLVGLGLLLALGFWLAIRAQIGVGDRQFLKSMIPHHAGAILMCERASIESPKIKALCQEIVESQQKEIAQMRSLLTELNAAR